MMQKIIILISSTMFFLLSLFSCDDEFDKMCEKYPELLENLSSIGYENINHRLTYTSATVANIDKKKLWALFEITLVEGFDLGIKENNKVVSLKNIVNNEFMKISSHIFSLFSDKTIPNKVYLFVSDINTVSLGVNPPHKHVSLFRGVEGIKEVKVMCSSCLKKESHSAYVGYICEFFRDCTNLEKVNLENLNLNYLEVSGLFAGCENLKEVELQRTPFVKVYKHNDNESIALMFARIFYDNIPDECIIVSCPDQIIKYALDKIDKSFYIGEQNDHIYIKKVKDELKDSTYYRKFYIYLNEFNQNYTIKKDEG